MNTYDLSRLIVIVVSVVWEVLHTWMVGPD